MGDRGGGGSNIIELNKTTNVQRLLEINDDCESQTADIFSFTLYENKYLRRREDLLSQSTWLNWRSITDDATVYELCSAWFLLTDVEVIGII